MDVEEIPRVQMTAVEYFTRGIDRPAPSNAYGVTIRFQNPANPIIPSTLHENQGIMGRSKWELK